MTRTRSAVLTVFLGLTVLLVSGAALAQTGPTGTPKAAPAAAKSAAQKPAAPATGLPSEETVNSYLFQMFGYEPTITWKVNEIRPSELPGLIEIQITLTTAQGTNQNRLLVTPDGKHVVTGEILPFGAKPFEEARLKLEKGATGPAKGPEKAPVTIVEFSDMQCPHCQKAEPAVEQLLALEPQARFVFQNFPLPAHNWAMKGAEYVDCVSQASNEALWKFIQKTFAEQSSITDANADEKLKAIVTASGGKADEVAACAVKAETRTRVEASLALGKSVGVTGTPSLFINGRMVSGTAPIEVLKKMVEFQASQQEKEKSDK